MPERGEAQLLSLQLVSTNRDAVTKPRIDWEAAVSFWLACTALGAIAALFVVFFA